MAGPTKKQLEAEVARLERELAEAKAEIERLRNPPPIGVSRAVPPGGGRKKKRRR